MSHWDIVISQVQAKDMDWTLQSDRWKSENLKPVEILKNHFNIRKSFIDFQNKGAKAQTLSLPGPFGFDV